jgi:catechol 2,3-dioxygenase-like lactoylglutathione lyase family enzyme
MTPIVIPMLPCADIDEIADFFTALGFTVVYRQVKPNPFVALEGYGFPIQYYGIDGHLPEASHSTCGVVVADTVALFGAFAAGLRGRYGKLPVAGFPRITRPRPRKNVEGHTGFSLIDPAGNWIRVFEAGEPEPVVESSPLRDALLNAVVLADSKGDDHQAAKILRGAVRRADASDPAAAEAQKFLAELDERARPPDS